jgi:hypothetical protein
MSLRLLLSIPGCVIAWAVLPLLAIGGTVVLFVYAVLAEASRMMSGSALNSPDPSAARAMAARICFGYQVETFKAQSRTPL